jgi:hypothetical protein
MLLSRRSLPLLLVALLALAIPASAPAKVNVAVGLGDQSPKMFANSNYKALGIKKVRYFIEWDAASDPDELQKAEDFVDAARGAGAKVLMHISTNNLQAYKATLPTLKEYKLGIAALIEKFKPLGVTEWGAWNEANHVTQPTYKSPKAAAQFYKAMKAQCSGCTIVALDVLDQKGVESYIKRWFAAAGAAGKSAKIIGIHNYSEVNRRIKKGTDRYPGTARIIKAVRKKNKKAKFWYTETGGVVNFGRNFPCDKRRPVSRTKFLFQLVKKFQKDVVRLYNYNFTGADCDGFDAGLTESDGSIRPAYTEFKKQLRNHAR